jgi:hypothetical protein
MQELTALWHLLGLRLQDVDRDLPQDWVQAHTNGSLPPSAPTVAGAVETLFGTVHTPVAQARSG